MPIVVDSVTPLVNVSVIVRLLAEDPGVLVVTPTTPLLGLLAALRPRVLRLLLITVYSCVAALASVGAPDEANAKFG